MTNKINAKLVDFRLHDFKSAKDRDRFDKFANDLLGFHKGVVITPFYSEEGELMSFVVDSKKVAKIIKGGGSEE